VADNENNLTDEQELDFQNPVRLRVGKCIKTRRLDKYLHGKFSNFSRVVIQKTIKLGHVTVNNHAVKPSFQLTPGDRIELTLPDLPSNEILPQELPLEIIHEDEDIIVINKQANLIVHPARNYKDGTLVNALLFYSDELSNGFESFRPGIVHRLDRNTTGVMVVAKNDNAQSKIATQFQDRVVEKTYLAIVQGTPELNADCIKAPLGVHPRAREKYAVKTETGKEAITFYEMLKPFKGYSLLKLTPKTGRTHQLRVHLSHLHHPIVADDMYGGKLVYPWQIENRPAQPEDPIITRQALHASTLKFKHPTTDEFIQFEAPLAEDMQTLLDELRKHRAIEK